MKCPQCGDAVPEGAKVCPSCNTAIVWNDPNATWAGSTSTAAAKANAGDDVTKVGFARQPSVGSDVLTPPPGFASTPPPATPAPPSSPHEAATWMGGPKSPTFGVGPNAATSAPFNRGPMSANSPTSASWMGAAAAPAMGGPIDFGPRYRVDRLLGQGGMGAVYLAYDLELERQVALKLVKPELAVHPEAMARFRQELLLASKISHRNILRIHDLSDAGGMKFISMAFVDGEDLHHLLMREGKLPLERMIHITRQLCAALDAAHSEGVVHRDLKPQNIMLGANDHVYVSDFGLAKSLGAISSMTQSGEMLGTPRYMAPEQVEARSVDARTDIYALGLIFYEMVTGDVPFTAETTLQLMYKRAHDTPPAPNTIVPDLPDWLNNVIMKCLERDPANRYQSTRDILTDIDAQRKPELAPEPVRTIIKPAPAAPPARSPWTRFGMAAAVFGMLMGLVGVPQIRHLIFSGKTASTAAQPTVKSVAVLPLRIVGDEKALGYVAGGVVEALTAKLTQVKGISVTSSAAIEKIGKIDSPIEAGRALGANYVVDGSLQGSGNNIRILISLIDAKTGQAVMVTKEFSGVTGDLLTLEDNIYSESIKALQVTLTADEMAKAGAHPTERIDAYQSYLQGRNALRGKPGADVVKGAIGDFDKAIKADPLFALAYTGIADASLRMYRDTKDPQWAQKAVSAAEHAGQLAQDMPEVHFALGSVYDATGKKNEAVAELQNAVKLAPNSDEGYRRLGDALNSIGSKQEAISAYSKAIEINPYYWYNYLMRGNAYFNWGKDEEAAHDYKKVTELAPKNPKGYSNLGAIYMRQGKWNDAIPYLKQATDVDPAWKNAWSNLGSSYFYLKRYEESAKYFEKAVELAPTAEFIGNLAEAYRWMGDKAKANATYDRAIALAQKEVEVNPRDKFSLGSLALYYAKKGDDKTAQQYIRRARAIDQKDVALIYNSAIVDAIGGRADEAIKDLREAVKNGYGVGQIKDDPDFQNLVSTPAFAQFLKDVGGNK